MASLDVVRRLRQDLTGTTAGLEAYVDLSDMEGRNPSQRRLNAVPPS